MTDNYLFVAEIFINDFLEKRESFWTENTDNAVRKITKDINEYFCKDIKQNEKISYKLYKFGQGSESCVVDCVMDKPSYLYDKRDLHVNFKNGELRLKMASDFHPTFSINNKLDSDECKKLHEVMDKYYMKYKVDE